MTLIIKLVEIGEKPKNVMKRQSLSSRLSEESGSKPVRKRRRVDGEKAGPQGKVSRTNNGEREYTRQLRGTEKNKPK